RPPAAGSPRPSLPPSAGSYPAGSRTRGTSQEGEHMSTRDQHVRPRGRGWGRYRSGATAAVALLMALGSATVVVASQPPAAGAATSPSLTVTPSTGLVSNRPVSVVVTGASPGSTIVAVECDPTAF